MHIVIIIVKAKWVWNTLKTQHLPCTNPLLNSNTWLIYTNPAVWLAAKFLPRAYLDVGYCASNDVHVQLFSVDVCNHPMHTKCGTRCIKVKRVLVLRVRTQIGSCLHQVSDCARLCGVHKQCVYKTDIFKFVFICKHDSNSERCFTLLLLFKSQTF